MTSNSKNIGISVDVIDSYHKSDTFVSAKNLVFAVYTTLSDKLELGQIEEKDWIVFGWDHIKIDISEHYKIDDKWIIFNEFPRFSVKNLKQINNPSNFFIKYENNMAN